MINDTSQWLKNIEIHKKSQLKGAKIVIIGVKSHNMNKQKKNNGFYFFCFLHPILNFTIVDI